jgi:hypothetical protein
MSEGMASRFFPTPRFWLALAAIAALSSVGCGCTTAEKDGGRDASDDVRAPGLDGVGTDANPGFEVARDGSRDAALDASIDGAADAPPDSALALDTGIDSADAADAPPDLPLMLDTSIDSATGGDDGEGAGGRPSCAGQEQAVQDALAYLHGQVRSCGLVDGNLYVNAATAMAAISLGDFALAEGIFDVFDRAMAADCRACLRGAMATPGKAANCPTCGDPSGGECHGGYQQNRRADGDGSASAQTKNDFWIGDNAWLLAALHQYAAAKPPRTKDYSLLVYQLEEWFRCLSTDHCARGTGCPAEMHSGYDSAGACRADDPCNTEGVIDVYGVLRFGARSTSGARADALAQLTNGLGTWFNANVWIPNAGVGGQDGGGSKACFSRGGRIGTLSTDHYAWAVFADFEKYACLLSDYAETTRGSLDTSIVEPFGPDWRGWSGAWTTSSEAPATVNITRDGNHMVLAFQWNSGLGGNWVNAERTIGIQPSPSFALHLAIQTNLTEQVRFEVKVADRDSSRIWVASYVLNHTLDASTETALDVWITNFTGLNTTDALIDAARTGVVLGKLAFAVNRNNSADLPGAVSIGAVSYTDADMLGAADGFRPCEYPCGDDWLGRLYAPSTASVAAGWCLQRGCADTEYRHYVSEMARVGHVPLHGVGRGIPGELFEGYIHAPATDGSAFFILADRCINPFDPEQRPIGQ